MFTVLLAIVGAAALQAQTGAAGSDADAELFETRVRPVLAERCYGCHGSTAQKGGLRLDSRAALLRGAMGGRAVVIPGHPETSPLIRAIRREGAIKMPPSGTLSQHEIDALSEWVRRGVPWPQTAPAPAKTRRLWSLQPVRCPPIPIIRNPQPAIRNPIDAFVLARLERERLKPSPRADRRTLIRRVTYDLTGLPPTLTEIDAFLNDRSPKAWENVIDRLLASPRYGERWGRYWLDVARYADTKGYVYEEVRRYPFSYTYRDWVIHALNEDMPYDQFLVQQLAADCLPQPQNRPNLAALGFLTCGRRFVNNLPDVIDDRIDVVMRGTQALTVSCARCHDHKFDPIPTQDYYSLYGIFAGSTERIAPLVDSPARTKEYDAYEAELNKREAALHKEMDAKRAEVSDRLRGQVARYLPAVLDVEKLPGVDFYVILAPEDVNPAVVRRWTAWLAEKSKRFDPVFAPWHALEALPEAEFKKLAPPLAARFAANADPRGRLNQKVASLFAGPPPASMREVAERYGRLLECINSRWKALVKADGAAPALPDPADEQLRQVLYAPDSPSTIPPMRIGEIEIYFDEKTRNGVNALQKKVDELYIESAATPPHAQILAELAEPRAQRIYLRGSPQTFGGEAPRRYLVAIQGKNRPLFRQGTGRLELAHAIASRTNPLTARVMVNRVWMRHFGAALVHTPSDFGARSEPPTHPELLDWLAARFMEDGWSFKRLHRLILTSATYMQASEDVPANRKRDPENRLLWRVSRQRLDLESTRDSVLAVSGALDLKMGGPAVEITTAPFSGRRTVYGLIDRQNLPGMFRVFDFANPDQHSPQRFVTTVPQQALFLMNSPFMTEAARRLAAGASKETTPETRIQLLYHTVLRRDPTATESARGARYLSAAGTLPVAKRDKGEQPLTALERYAQALLLTNEFVFVD
jgi:mono/diheme cytochrome c family protein